VSEGAQRYDLLDRIAAGGMGEVFVGRARGEHGFQKPVAIKRILPELARNPEFVVRFVAEAKLAVSLSHANVVQVFDLGRVGDELLLVMEYVRGTDLAQLLARLTARGEQPPVNIAVYIAMEALKGLVYAHERRELDGRVGIVHCDLSPSNLLLSFAGEVKIGDFGVAQALDVPRRKGTAGGVMGKVRYLAPEQLLGEAVDARTDLYALGVVLHEALTLERPFGGGDLDAIATAVVRGTHPPVSQLRPDVPTELDRLVQKAMSRELSLRPASAREMLAELARIAQRLEPVTPPDVGTWARDVVGAPGANASARRPTASMSAVPADPLTGKATATFVVREHVDGVTVLEPDRAAPPPSRRGVILAGLALGLALFLAVPLARRWSHPARATTPTIAVGPIVVEPTSPPNIEQTPTPPASEPPAMRAADPPLPRRHTASAGVGYVNIYAEPWANVIIDGKAAGTTPLARLPLAAGTHRVRLQHPPATRVDRVVRIERGRTELIDVDLDSQR
jgi:serine/threonine-protein kinase